MKWSLGKCLYMLWNDTRFELTSDTAMNYGKSRIQEHINISSTAQEKQFFVVRLNESSSDEK